MGWNADSRDLAAAIWRVTTRCAASGAQLGCFEMQNGCWLGGSVLFGLADDKWCTGLRTGVMLSLSGTSPAGYTVEIEHSTFKAAFPTVLARVAINGHFLRSIRLDEGSVSFFVPPALGLPQSAFAIENLSLDQHAAPDVSILITSRSATLVAACLASIAAARLPEQIYEVLVVNNGGERGEFAAMLDAGLQFRFLDSAGGLSFSEANNRGLAAARGRHVVFLNDDVLVQRGCIAALSAALEAEPDVGAVSASLLFPSGEIQELGCLIGPDAVTLQRGAGDPPFSLSEQPIDPNCDFASAACLMVRRADALAIGGFDPGFTPAYWEDADFCLRLLAKGLSTVWVKEAVALHIQSATTATPEAGFSKNAALALNRRTFLTRWGPWLGERKPVHLPPPAPPAKALPQTKAKLVVSLGPLQAGEGRSPHEAAYTAIETFRGQNRPDWRFVAAVELGLGEDPARLDALIARLGAQDAVLVNPSTAQVGALLAEAAVLVSAAGLVGEQAQSGKAVAEAVAYGCTPVAFELGAAAEMCDRLDTGLTFSTVESLVEALHLAADGVRRPGAAEAENAAALRPAPQPEPNSRGVALVVLGMHRSGTSALTRVLSLAGASLPVGLMQPQADNPTGHWEPVKIAQLNDRILADLGARWDDIAVVDLQNQIAARRDRWLGLARRALRESLIGPAPVALKDPRISVLLPLWREALRLEGWDARFVHSLRHPGEVAASLTARNGFSTEKGLLLWAAYTVAAETGITDAAVCRINYAELLKASRRSVSQINSMLNAPAGPELALAAEDIKQFLAPALRHHREETHEPPGSLSPIVDLYQVLADRSATASSRTAHLKAAHALVLGHYQP